MAEMKKPEIRFKGFEDDWEQRKLLDEVFSVDTGKSKFTSHESGKYEILGSTSVIGYDSSYDYEGDFLLTARVGANAGELYRHSGKVKISDNTVFIQGNQLDFIYYALLNFDIKRLSFGTGQPLVKASELKEQLITMPVSKRERDYIGTYFHNLDHLITLHQRKYDKLVSMKKSMLEKMFPKDGHAVPEVRFKGFTGDWEQRKFEKVFEFLQNNALSRADLSDEQGFALNVHYGDILVKFGEVLDIAKENLPYIADNEIVKKYSTSELQNGDVIIADAAEDETVGKCTEITGLQGIKVLAGLHTIPVRASEKFSPGYLGYYMNSNSYHDQLLPLMQGTKVSSISKSAIQDTVILYPESLQEQAQIGTYFMNLERLITLHQRELEKLQNIKKSCLEKMFV